MAEIFVFGSNEVGAHAGGAAREALAHHGAAWGVAAGRQGNSYAIPTLDRDLEPLPLHHVMAYVGEFIRYAEGHPGLTFRVTQVGCGIAGFAARDIAPLFIGSPVNCTFDESWRPWLGDRAYWGRFGDSVTA